jgi:short-subunit dehydrogenase
MATRTTRPQEQELRVAVITGASRGIGAETARRLAKLGYSLVLSARSAAALEELAQEFRKSGVEVAVVLADVKDRAQLRALASETLSRFGRVDVVLHNAGVVHPGVRVENLTDEQLNSILNTNLIAPIELTREFLPTMISQKSGYFGFVGSVGGHIPLPTASIYSTTKFGMRGFAMALRREVRGHGIHVCLISPGYIKTELTDEVWDIMKGYPMAMGSVDSVAAAIVKSISHPRRELIMPFYYRNFVWVERNLTFVTDAVAKFYMTKIFAGYDARRRSREVASKENV